MMGGGIEPAAREPAAGGPDCAASPPKAAAAATRRRVAALIAAASVEMSPRDRLDGAALRALFPAGTTVFVNHPPRATHHDIVAACIRLRRAGFVPVPHLAARRLASFTQLDDLLRRAAAAAAIKRALIIAGDPERPLGPFRDSLDLLASGAIESHGLVEVSFAVYPETHPRIDDRTLDAALDAKLALAGRRGLTASLVTQFGFVAAPIAARIAALRARGIACPIEIGIAGPGNIATLAKFAIRCGVGASLQALARGETAIARVLTRATPDALIRALVAAEDPAAPIDGLHIFTFGGLRQAALWRRARLAEEGPEAKLAAPP
jgi:methylenetetrahydrofolate reductase (NADPH)